MKASRRNRQWMARCAWGVAFALAAAMILPAGARAAALVDSPFLVGYDGWTDTFDGFPTPTGTSNQVLPQYGILLYNDTLVELSDGRPDDGGGTGTAGGTFGDGTYVPFVMVNKTAMTPATYDLTARLSTTDNDGIGVVFGYQDNDNYFRVGLRQEGEGTYKYGFFGNGLTVQKVVNGVITQLGTPYQLPGNPPLDIYDWVTNTPFDLGVSVSGSSYSISLDGMPVVSGNDTDLQPGYYGIQSWGIKQGSTASMQWGMQLHSMTVSSATLNKTHTFSGLWPVAFQKIMMTNSDKKQGAEGEDHGNFRLDFRNGTIADDTNGYEWATAGTPNVDFIGPAIIVSESGAQSMGDYEMRVRLTCRDDDGIGVLVRATDNGWGGQNFYRINFTRQSMGTGASRAPKGMSVQKYVVDDLGAPIWTELFRDDQSDPLFVFTDKISGSEISATNPARDEIPFDLKVIVDGNKISVQVIDDPDGAHTVINYPDIFDNDNPLLTGTVGLTNWGSGDGDNGTVFGGWGGNPDAPLLVEIGTFPEPDKPGDANRDGKVDKKDAALLAANWLKGTGAVWGEGDFNKDGAVDDLDLAILAANWAPGDAATVPEPGTLALLLAAAASLVVLRRRK
ncbi:MAG: PEP-CTERM sorting domain-containing protein [Pirellulales bacterium]|nr:PEP-CTERM sorting domain-containing protein [Pirellulales bacterium]